MKHNLIETALGAVVIVIALGFLFYSAKTAEVGDVEGYEISANFSATGGLAAGDDVRISGVKIGSVEAIELDSETYLARVIMSIDDAVQLPLDTAALISSESLLGGKYLSLEPGAEEDFIEDGGMVEFTQAPQNLEQLLGEFIFSVQNTNNEPAPAPTAAAADTFVAPLPEFP